jgi:hypothetical protein
MIRRLAMLTLIDFAIGVAAVALAIVAAVAAGAAPPRSSDPDLAPWFRALQAPSGMSCCDRADGHILADGDWRTAGDGYEIKIQGQWVAVPPEAVLQRADNPTGGAVAFYPAPWTGGGAPPIYCFVRPAET